MFLAGEKSDGPLMGLRLVAKGRIDDAKLHRETHLMARRPPSWRKGGLHAFLAGVCEERNMMDGKGLGILTSIAGADICILCWHRY